MSKQKMLHRSTFRQADLAVTIQGTQKAYELVKKSGMSEAEIIKAGFALSDVKFRTVSENCWLVGLQRRLTEMRQSKVSQKLNLKLVKRFGIEKLTK